MLDGLACLMVLHGLLKVAGVQRNPGMVGGVARQRLTQTLRWIEGDLEGCRWLGEIRSPLLMLGWIQSCDAPKVGALERRSCEDSGTAMIYGLCYGND